jgi:hypothetical protein
VQSVDVDEAKPQLTIGVDFVAGSRLAHADAPGEHPAHDTLIKRLRHLNVFAHECHLDMCVCPTAACA